MMGQLMPSQPEPSHRFHPGTVQTWEAQSTGLAWAQWAKGLWERGLVIFWSNLEIPSLPTYFLPLFLIPILCSLFVPAKRD